MTLLATPEELVEAVLGMLRNQLTAPPSIPWREEDQRGGEGWRGVTFPHWPLTELPIHRTAHRGFLSGDAPHPLGRPSPQQMAAEPRPPSRGQQLTHSLVHSLRGSEHLELSR